MTVSEIKPTELINCYFNDYKGNWIPFEIVTKYFTNWEIVFAISTEIHIVAPKSATEEFIRDLRGTINGDTTKQLFMTQSEITEKFKIHEDKLLNEHMIRAWLWSCAYHGLAQREFPLGCVGSWWAI